MERIFIHVGVEYATECLITTKRDAYGRKQYHPEIRTLLSKYELIYGMIPSRCPLERGFENTIELEAGETQ
jgi:hypothetical protein